MTAPERLPILLLAAIAALAPLSVDMYLPAMPGIAAGLDTTISSIQNSLSIFLFGFGGGMILYGPLSDRYGRRPLALFGLGGFTVACLLITFSRNGESFLLFRFLQGVLGSAATVTVPAMIRDVYGRNTAKGLSSMSMIMLIAPLVAPLAGSLLLHLAPWHIVFWFQAAYGALLLLLAWRLLPETRPLPDQPEAFSLLRNYRVILGKRHVYFDMLSSLLSALAFFTYLTSVAFIYISWFGAKETTFGILFALSAGSLILVNFINVRMVSRMGARRMMLTGLGIGVVSALMLVLLLSLGAGLYWVVACFFLIVAGLGISWINADALVLIQFPKQASSAAAVLGTFRFGFGATAGPILALFATGTPQPAAILILACIAAAMGSQLLRRLVVDDEAN